MLIYANHWKTFNTLKKKLTIVLEVNRGGCNGQKVPILGHKLHFCEFDMYFNKTFF